MAFIGRRMLGRRDDGAGQGTGSDLAGRGRSAAAGALGIAGFAGELRDRVYHWALAEVGPGRLVPWLPVAFGAGIVVYFTAPREPLLWAAAVLAIALAAATIASRDRDGRADIAAHRGA